MFEFTVLWSPSSPEGEPIISLMTFPAMLTVALALIMTAIRLLIMYYPSKAANWRRYSREGTLVVSLVVMDVFIGIALWSAAAVQGVERVAAVLETLSPLSAVIMIAGAVALGKELKKVEDFSNMSHDIRLLGAFLLGILCLRAAVQPIQMHAWATKYYNIVFLWVSHPPIVWICVLRPVRSVLRQIPERRRSTVELLLVTPMLRRRSSTLGNGNAVVPAVAEPGRNRGHASDEHRLAGIMGYLPLREAFGEFCRRSLCSESFQFLLDVSEFKIHVLEVSADESNKNTGFMGFGSYFAIVNDYIKDGSHSEVNIDFKTKRDILKYAKFKAYASLDLDGRQEIFTAAEQEIKKMLVDNLLNKFLSSAQYKEVVDFEGRSQE